MTNIKLSVAQKIPTSKSGQAVVIGVARVNGKLQLLPHSSDASSLDGLDLDALGVSETLESIAKLPGANGGIFALVGAGDEPLDEDSLRELGATASRALTGIREIVFDLPTDDDRDAVSLLEGALLGIYKYANVFDKKPQKTALQSVTVLSEHKAKPTQLNRSVILAEAVEHVRNLVNTPPNDLFPKSFADIVAKDSKITGLKVTVLDEKQLKAGNYGGILAVGLGSSRPPRLVKIEYRPAKARQHLALVGKGITFDTGGISIKPAASMVGMKYDMTGAATVYQAIAAIAQLKLPVRVTSYLCLAENMPSATATRPNDVIRIRNGKTVEVLNTDAEGRLVLADGLSAASEEQPDLIVDVATLTGAARVALGDRYSALMGSADAVSTLEAAAFDSGELVWHMPLPVELKARLKTDVADLANAKIGSTAGGMLLAGVFLREFIGKSKKTGQPISWAHLDIAGTANNEHAAYGYTPKGATGVMVRTLVSVAEGMSR
ncbi:MAG: leucyl aminopeptidase [Rhodoluna sp.]